MAQQGRIGTPELTEANDAAYAALPDREPRFALFDLTEVDALDVPGFDHVILHNIGADQEAFLVGTQLHTLEGIAKVTTLELDVDLSAQAGVQDV